jgi:hypothetical protein
MWRKHMHIYIRMSGLIIPNMHIYTHKTLTGTHTLLRDVLSPNPKKNPLIRPFQATPTVKMIGSFELRRPPGSQAAWWTQSATEDTHKTHKHKTRLAHTCTQNLACTHIRIKLDSHIYTQKLTHAHIYHRLAQKKSHIRSLKVT